jgi:hypothetical protein
MISKSVNEINSDNYITLEKEVINIIEKGPRFGYKCNTIPSNALNNFISNDAKIITKQICWYIKPMGCCHLFKKDTTYKIFIDNYGNIYSFTYKGSYSKYISSNWQCWCNYKYEKKLSKTIIDIINLIIENGFFTQIINDGNHFESIIQGIVKIKINKQLEKNNNQNIDYNFICSITHEIMIDPVITSDGHTYERSAIEKWLNYNNYSPMTREIITKDSIVPNIALRDIISKHLKKN